MEPLHITELRTHRPRGSFALSEPGDVVDESADEREFTLEQSPSSVITPAPTTSPAIIAALSASGAALVSLLSPALDTSLGVALLCALAALAFGCVLGRLLGRYPSGGLLAAASWTIGAIGIGAIGATGTKPLLASPSILWTDAGLVGIAIGARYARGSVEVPSAFWVAPGRILALIGASHAAVWLPTWCWLAASPTPFDHLALLPATAAIAAAIASVVRAGPEQPFARIVTALSAGPAVILAWPHPHAMLGAALTSPEAYPLAVLPVVAVISGLVAALARRG